MTTSTLRQPAIFLSHGGGPGFFMDATGSLFADIDKNSKGKKFFEGLSKLLPQPPRAVLIVSAHWEEKEFTIGYQSSGTSLIYDYYGFPRETYAPHLTYEVPTDLEIADNVASTLKKSGIDCRKMDRGFDHGVFLPLKLIFPEANIPVVQLSLKANLNTASHVAVGKALASLRDDNILIIGSGSMTHNLGEMRSGLSKNNAAQWASTFTEWIREQLEGLNKDNLATVEDNMIHIMELAPEATRSHPRTEHLVPLLFAFGAGVGIEANSDNDESCVEVKCRRVYTEMAMGTLSLDTYLFE